MKEVLPLQPNAHCGSASPAGLERRDSGPGQSHIWTSLVEHSVRDKDDRAHIIQVFSYLSVQLAVARITFGPGQSKLVRKRRKICRTKSDCLAVASLCVLIMLQFSSMSIQTHVKCLASFVTWCSQNHLKLNIGKIKELVMNYNVSKYGCLQQRSSNIHPYVECKPCSYIMLYICCFYAAQDLPSGNIKNLLN